MEKTTSSDNLKQVIFGKNAYDTLQEFLLKNSFSKIFILVDENTHEFCLPLFLANLNTSLETEVIEMEAGEENKNLDTCEGIWNVLSELGGDRKSILINLGGGVVTDLGGFIACTFKRGISFINVPTTLLSMVDAAVGGKNGINLGSLKNQIGVIKPAELVLVDTQYLESLPAPEMRSGLAEMLKHGLIKDEAYWKKLIDLQGLDTTDLDELVKESILIKEAFVEKDPREEHIRKSLNFGHTLGHAIESYFLESDHKLKLLHGEAVAAGMIMAAYLSAELLEFPADKLAEIRRIIKSIYGLIDLQESDFEKILALLKFDKKNEGGNINFVLLKDIGSPVLDCQVPDEVLHKSLNFYLETN